jgi:hypothetical protein
MELKEKVKEKSNKLQHKKMQNCFFLKQMHLIFCSFTKENTSSYHRFPAKVGTYSFPLPI